MTEESVGKCPCCAHNTLTRYGNGWYSFDACPNCGFAHGNDSAGEDVEAWDVLKLELNILEKYLPMKGLSSLKEFVASNERYEETIFAYPKPMEDLKQSLKTVSKAADISGSVTTLSNLEMVTVFIKIKLEEDVFTYKIDQGSKAKFYLNGRQIDVDNTYVNISDFKNEYLPVAYLLILSGVLKLIKAKLENSNVDEDPRYKEYLRTFTFHKEIGVSRVDLSTDKNNNCGIGDNIIKDYQLKDTLFKLDI